MSVTTEKFVAKVVVNDDPEKRARVKVVCPDFTGYPDVVLPSWIEPMLDWGWFYVPDVDEHVEIEVVTGTAEDETPGQSAILDPTIRWRGKRYYHEAEEAPTPIHEDFKANYGKRRGFATPAGHILLFDDTEGDERIGLSLALSGGGRAFINLDKSGNVSVVNGGAGGLVLLGAGADEATATSRLVRGDEWKAWAAPHTHPTGTGPSGSPAEPIPDTVLSETSKVK
jgi:hypothetical protein